MRPLSILLLVGLIFSAPFSAGAQEQLEAPQWRPLHEESSDSRTEAVLAASVGIPVNGFPNWEERVIHEWINRARSDPQFEMARCGNGCGEAACYTAAPPVPWSESLNRAARFHADEMLEQDYFAHDSRCTVVSNIGALYPVTCAGQANCSCVGGVSSCSPAGCTVWYTRVALFGSSSTGEIASSATDPNYAFYNWLFENSYTTQCQFTLQNGHRWNILSPASSAVGLGVSSTSVGDFGRSQEPPSKLVSAAHYPRQAASVEIWANWYDTAAPRSASVVVDGVCLPMTLKRGTPLNGAWQATASGLASGFAEPGCHRYYISFVDASGNTITYPGSGSLGIGDPATCPDWSTARASGSCSSTRRRGHAARR